MLVPDILIENISLTIFCILINHLGRLLFLSLKWQGGKEEGRSKSLPTQAWWAPGPRSKTGLCVVALRPGKCSVGFGSQTGQRSLSVPSSPWGVSYTVVFITQPSRVVISPRGRHIKYIVQHIINCFLVSPCRMSVRECSCGEDICELNILLLKC